MKTAIVFGATSGIGKEISKLLLNNGYKVVFKDSILHLKCHKNLIANDYLT